MNHLKDILTGLALLTIVAGLGALSFISLGDNGPFILFFLVCGTWMAKAIGCVIRTHWISW